jgi:hypothetical protein
MKRLTARGIKQTGRTMAHIHFRSGECSPEEGNVEDRRVQRAIEQVGCVSYEDLLQDLESVETGRPEHLRTSIGLNRIGSCLLNVSERVEENCETEGFQTAKNVCNLSDWRLDDSYDGVSTKSSKA